MQCGLRKTALQCEIFKRGEAFAAVFVAHFRISDVKQHQPMVECQAICGGRGLTEKPLPRRLIVATGS